MGRIRTAVVECKNKEVGRQIKEQFINGLNDNEMLTEVIRELKNCEENVIIPSETVLVWANKVEAQRAQTVVINSLHESKNFETITHKENRFNKNMQVT